MPTFFHLEKILACLGYLLSLTVPIHSQSALDSSEFTQLIRPAQELLTARKYEEAAVTAKKLLSDLSRKGSYPTHYEAFIYIVLGDCSFGQHEWPQARDYYQRGLKDQVDKSLRSDLLNRLGRLYLETKDFEKAGPPLEEALQLRREIYGDQHLLVADVINNLGIRYLHIGDFIESLNYQQQALRIRQAGLEPDDPQLGQSYNNLGQCYEDMGDLTAATDAYENALLRYPLHTGLDKERADVLLNLGNVFFQKDELIRARMNFERAMDLYQDIGDVDGQAICLNNLGNIAFQEDRFRQAEQLIRRALHIREDLYGVSHPDVAASWSNLAMIYRMRDEPDQAIAALRKCLLALNFHPDQENFLDQVNGYQPLINALYNLADLYYVKFLLSDDPEFLGQALTQLDHNDEVLDYLRIRYETRGSRLNLVAIGHEVYSFAISILLELQKITGESRYWHRAFRYSEKSKALLLLDGMYRSKARTFGDVPEQILAEVDTLERRIVELEKEKYLYQQARTNAFPLDSLENLLFLTRQSFSQKLKEINSRYPRYYQLRYENPIPSVPRIQQELLDTNQTLIEYFVGVDLVVFVLNRDQFDVVLVPLNRDFETQLDTIVPLIRRFPFESTQRLSENLQTYSSAAFNLYRYLIAPLEARLKNNLVIVPDDKLGFLPFDALLTERVDSIFNLRDHPYLIRKYAISYNFSASQLEEMKGKPVMSNGTRYLGFAPEFAGMQSEGLNELIFNDQEVQEAKAKLGGKTFIGNEATKRNFIRTQQNYGILHLATHGKVNSAEDDFSFLAFARTPGMPQSEYLLYLKEIYALPIQAQMVILSACETGTGKLYRGEGIASIARGFSYAGASSLIATRWSVNDKTTTDLMDYFLDDIKQGMTKDRAIQQATLQYIGSQNHRYAHPFYWSSFMAIGDMRPLIFDMTLAWPVGLAVVLLLTVIWYFRKIKVSKRR
ncbi:MAG: CHAT domain-containing protein [Saprospiraceae bacterium]|nr:CHAT domain-containing protein [Saprospiraceae bacterium]